MPIEQATIANFASVGSRFNISLNKLV